MFSSYLINTIPIFDLMINETPQIMFTFYDGRHHTHTHTHKQIYGLQIHGKLSRQWIAKRILMKMIKMKIRSISITGTNIKCFVFGKKKIFIFVSVQ